MNKQPARPVKVICDSTCDLPEEQIARYGLVILSLYINLAERSVHDRTEIEVNEIFDWAQEHGKQPTTSCPTQQDCENVIAPLIEQGCDVLVFTISSHLSSTFDRVSSVAAQFPQGRVRAIDSCVTTAGLGLLAIEAAEMAQRGFSADEIDRVVRPLSNKARVEVLLSTVKYLYYGGRCSAIAAIGASVLGIRQMIGMENGIVIARERLRGKMVKVVEKYCELLKPRLLGADPKRIFIEHTGYTEDGLLGYLHSFVRSLGIFEEIVESKAGCVIGAHVGPGAVALVFRDQ